MKEIDFKTTVKNEGTIDDEHGQPAQENDKRWMRRIRAREVAIRLTEGSRYSSIPETR